MSNRAVVFAVTRCREEGLGWLLVAGTGRGVCHVRFGDDPDALAEELQEEIPFAVFRRSGAGDALLGRWLACIRAYADGDDARIDVPLDVSGSRFQRRVWAALRRIPRGETRSYSEVARSLGMPAGARAVARACATNPVALAIPCHRVIARDGGLGGYAYGLERKRRLLDQEQVPAHAGEADRIPSRA